MKTRTLAFAFAIACALTSGIALAANQSAVAAPSIDTLAEQLAGEYAAQQSARLAKLEDRDSLIAAALIATPNSNEPEPRNHDEIIERLVAGFPSDPLALYAAALVCNTQTRECKTPELQAKLLEVEPDNALNYLLTPNGTQPGLERLHQAASASHADSHFSSLLGIVRSTLADQPAPFAEGRQTDEKELALYLRRNEVGYVPWPKIGPTMSLCNAALATRVDQSALQADCAKLGSLLFADRSDNLVTRMFGVTLLRRFAKGSPDAAEALEMRRKYVWLSELPDETKSTELERLQDEEVAFGEWEAYQRHGERQGATRTPPTDWVPRNPEFIPLPEERTAKPAPKKS